MGFSLTNHLFLGYPHDYGKPQMVDGDFLPPTLRQVRVEMFCRRMSTQEERPLMRLLEVK